MNPNIKEYEVIIMPRTDYILKLKLMLAIVSAVLCVCSSFALGYSCFADISNVDAQISFATYYDNYDFLGSNGVPTGSDTRVTFGAESDYGSVMAAVINHNKSKSRPHSVVL